MAKWLDKYDAPQAKNGIEGTMGGLTDVGFNYNGAWGGTMQMGGSLPGAVGFMYARTQSPAPANGPYAKKTKASAQDGKEMTYTWDPSGSSSDKYMLKRTVTPYTSKRDIRRFTQVPINPNDVNFISNYDHTSREDQTPNPTAVPYKGEKHWNIDRFIIQPHFSKINTDLQNADNDKKQMKRNVLADMYKYFMVQNQGDKKDAWKQAKQFMREEINPRVKGPFYDQYLRTKGMPLTGLGMSITDAISPQYMYWVNYMMEDAATGVDSFIARKYTQNPVSPSKYKKFGMDWLMNYKGLSRKEARDYLKQSEIFPNYTPSDAEPTDMTTGYRNGGSMKYYQEGLDFKPKTISQNGSAITTDINDYRRWQDSVRNYIRGQKDLAKARTDVKKNINTFSLMSGSGLVGAFSNLIQGDIQGKRRFLPEYKEQSLPRQYWGPEEKYPQVPKDVIVVGDPAFDTSKRIKGLTEALSQNKNLTGTNFYPYSGIVEIYHPPVRRSLKYQPPVKKQPPAKKQQTSRTIGPFPLPESKKLAKPIPIPREAIDLGYELPVPGAPRIIETSKFENKPTKFSFTYPTGKYNEQKTMYFPSKAALKSFVGSIRDASYQEGADYATATGTLQDGGDIPVDPMGYWNPENIGNPVTIPSNIITMEGVDQPLLGISDTGDVQYMEPGEDYEFDGEYVTEYPVAQKGKTIPVPTTADSARLYNAQVALNKFYENEMKAGRIKKSKWSDGEVSEFPTSPTSPTSFHPQGLRQANLDFYRGEINQRNEHEGREQFSDESYKQYFNLSPEQVKQLEYKGLAQTKGGSEYQDYYRDIITPMQNLAAPFALIDYRIRPQREILYSPINKDGVTYPGGDVMVYDYDPLAIKPYHMRTPKEKIEWEKKYGKKETTKAKPTPSPVKKKVVTPAPEPVKETKAPEPVRQTAPLVIPSFTPPIVPSGSVGVFGPGKARIGEYDEKTNTFYPDYGNLAARSKANQSDTDLLTDEEKLASYIASKTGKKPKIDVTLAKQRNGGVNNADAQPLKKLDQLLNFTNYNKPTKGGWLDKYQ